MLTRRTFLKATGAAMTLAAANACGLRPGAAPDADFHLAPGGDDAWSGTLPAPNRAGTDGPVRTLARARDLVRAHDRAPGRAVTVQLRGGVYEDSAVAFDERDVDTRYTAYPGETPELVGGRRVTGWEPYSGDIWKAQVTPGWRFYALFENGTRATIARHPNDGYATVHTPYPDAYQTTFGYRDGDLPAGLDTRQLQVFLWPGGESGEWNWFSDTLDVAALDEAERRITLAHPAHYPIGRGSRYYIRGALSLLDAPGEFFLDTAASTLYYWPRQTPIDAQEIVAATTQRVIACVGRSPEDRVRGLTFEGLTLRVSDAPGETGTQSEDDGLVFLQNADAVRVVDCRIANTGLHGVLMTGAVRGCAVTGCEIADVGHTGVQVNAPWTTEERVSTGNEIHNNHIHDTGKEIGHGAGIQLNNSGANKITHNRVHHTSRYAISLKSPRPGTIIGQTVEGTAVTRDNAKDFAHSRDNEIAFNDLSHANLDSQDTGVFESWGGGLGNHVHHNRIHHSDIHFSFGFGLYLDDAADGFTVDHNLLHDLQRERGLRGMLSSAFMIKGVSNVLTHNIAADNHALAGIRTFAMADEPNRDLVFSHNIVSNSGITIYDFTNWDPERFAEADYNCFYLAGIPVKLASIAPDLVGWQRHGYDAHALIAEPGFVDAEARDYRLRPDAAARALGLTSIPVGAMGLLPGFRYADPADPLARVTVGLPTSGGAGDDAETLVELAPGATATLAVSGRSATGYALDLQDAEITFLSADPAVAIISGKGQIKAQAPGTTEIAVEVTRGDVTLRTLYFIIVSQEKSVCLSLHPS